MISLVAALALSVVSTSSDGDTTVVFPEKLSSGDQYYAGDLTGLRNYLSDNANADPELFGQLDPALVKLETQSRNGYLVMGVGSLVGLSIAGVGAVLFVSNIGQPPGPNRNPALGLGVTMGGALLSVASVFAGVLMQPTRTQFLDVINHHNRLRPEKPLRLQLGFLPTPVGQGGIAFASARF